MSEHRASIKWQFTGGDFRRGKYSREHIWTFDGGLEVPASPSPSVVPSPYSNPSSVDPEEAYVAAIASCHMLTFVHLASREGFELVSYEDDAVGEMTKNAEGERWIGSVTLNPRIAYAGNPPSREQEQRLHEAAHHQCFIANSVKTEITVLYRDTQTEV
jgi:organic hydroperoxide reductase OsmC/OhrA